MRDAAQRHEHCALQLLPRLPRVPPGRWLRRPRCLCQEARLQQAFVASAKLQSQAHERRTGRPGSGSGRQGAGRCMRWAARPLLVCRAGADACCLPDSYLMAARRASGPGPPCLQETLNNLRTAMRETRIMCAVMLDTKVGSCPAGWLAGRLAAQIATPVHLARPCAPPPARRATPRRHRSWAGGSTPQRCSLRLCVSLHVATATGIAHATGGVHLRFRRARDDTSADRHATAVLPGWRRVLRSAPASWRMRSRCCWRRGRS